MAQSAPHKKSEKKIRNVAINDEEKSRILLVDFAKPCDHLFSTHTATLFLKNSRFFLCRGEEKK